MSRLNNRLLPILTAATLTLGACSTTRHVPDGSLLLDKTTINISDTAANPVQATELVNYLRQVPNHKVLGNWNLQLRTYSLSGADSTRWYNRWLRRLGKPPVIYSQRATDASANQLRLALINRGYLGATVDVDTVCHTAKKKIEVTYNVTPGAPHRLRSVSYDCTRRQRRGCHNRCRRRQLHRESGRQPRPQSA